MKTTCYCIYCRKHPLFKDCQDLPVLNGWNIDDFIGAKYDVCAREVECLEPVSDAFSMFDLDPASFDFPVTAYGDGYASTGADESDLTIRGCCGNEEDGEADFYLKGENNGKGI